MTETKVITAFTDEQVSRLTGISVGQLRYWDRTNFFRPEFAFDNRRDAFSRIYSYLDLVSLKVISRLRDEVSLQQLLLVKEKLKKITPELWRDLTLWVQKNNVTFVNPDTGEPEEVISGQRVMKLPLRDTIDDLDVRMKEIFARDNASFGHIEKHRRIQHNRPVIAGTRIPVSAVVAFHEAGYSVNQIIEEYPSLTPQDVKAALSLDVA